MSPMLTANVPVPNKPRIQGAQGSGTGRRNHSGTEQ
jgi:hypothetical protein